MESDTGGHALLRWNRALAGASDLSLQLFYDRRSEGGSGAKNLDTMDFEMQHRFGAGRRHAIVWGFGHREIRDAFARSLSFSIDPVHERTHLTNAFVQDEITLVDGALYLTVGSKFERSSFSGYNVQPSTRIVWRPTVRQSVWASASRAIRTPNRVERGMRLNVAAFPAGQLPGMTSIRGHEDSRSEELNAYEAGYRYQANRRIWFDLATFYNDYAYLSQVTAASPFLETEPGPPHLVFPLFFRNGAGGANYGVELTASYDVNLSWSLEGSYSFLGSNFAATEAGVSTDEINGISPRNQAHVASTFDLPGAFDVAAHAYFVDRVAAHKVPSYTRVDLNLSWTGMESMEWSVIGQNLLGTHREFGDIVSSSNPVGPSVFGKVSWRF
jgi:iron complex outermembrane receptor protein